MYSSLFSLSLYLLFHEKLTIAKKKKKKNSIRGCLWFMIMSNSLADACARVRGLRIYLTSLILARLLALFYCRAITFLHEKMRVRTEYIPVHNCLWNIHLLGRK